VPHPGYLLLESGSPDYLLLEAGSPDLLLLEGYYEREVSVGLPAAWAGALEPVAVAHIEWTMPIELSSSMYVSWEGTKPLELSTAMQLEWSGALGDYVSTPFAWEGVVIGSEEVPVLIGTPAFGAAVELPVSYQGAAVESKTLPVEWTGATGGREEAPVSWNQVLRTRERLPFEWLGYGTVRAFGSMPMPIMRSEQARDSLPVIWGGVFSAESILPASWTREVPAVSRMFLGWGVTIADKPGENALHFYPLREVAGDEQVPAQWLAAASQDTGEKIPFGILASTKAEGRLLLEWTGVVSLFSSLPAELRANIAQVVNIPYHSRVTAIAADSLPAAVLAEVQAAANLPLGNWPEGATILFIEGVKCVWVLAALPPQTDQWPAPGCKDGD
jgi:hypothetical protein